MSKKLLSEAQIRRFQSLANLPVLNEKYHKEEGMHKEGYGMREDEARAEEERDAYMKGPDSPEYKAYVKKYGERPRVSLREKEHGMEEGAHEMEEGMHGDEKKEGMHKEDMHEDMHDDAEEEKEMDMDPEPEMDEPGGDLDLSEEEARVIIELGKKLEGIMGAEEAGEDMPGEADPMGDELMEALAGVEVRPSREEVVEEVARRVARRLNEAKRAQRRLNRALGNK